MLDAIKRVNELRELLATARSERDHLSGTLAEIERHRAAGLVDAAGASDLAKLGKLAYDAKRTLRTLQAERELAERIERSIKTLRTRNGKTEDESAKRSA